MSAQEYEWQNDAGIVVLRATPNPAIGGGGGGVSPETIPTADPSGVTLDTTTYSNPVTGSGKVTTLVFPQDTAAIAIAIEGDAFPRWIFASDASDGLYMGDGTADPYQHGANVWGSTGGVLTTGKFQATSASAFVTDSVTMAYLPTADPHVAGQLYTTAGALMVSAG